MTAAEHDEQHGGEQHAAIELVDLRVDLLLAQRQRHRQNRFAILNPHRRGGDEVRVGADRFAGHERRPALEQDGAIDVALGARRQEARREQVALARREQPRAVEDVDVLRDDSTQPDHQVVVDRRGRGAVGGFERADVLDDAAGGGGRACGLHLEVGLHQVRDVGAGDERKGEHRHDGRGDKRDEQLAVEAGAHLAQQLAAGGRRPLRR